jgi:carbamoyl-phosphate synthase large subunit
VKVVVTGAGALLGQGIIRSLGKHRPDVEIVALDPSPQAAGLYWTRRRHIVPMAASPEYAAAIDRILEVERPDAVLVGTDVELAFFAQNRERLEAAFGCHVVVSSPQVIGIADDKYQTYQLMRDHGFDPPETRLPDQAHELVELVGFPLIVKPRVGARSVGVVRVDDAPALTDALRASAGLVVQECVGDESTEYTAGTITFGGQCLASILMRRDLRDGNTYRAFVERDEVLEGQVRAMAEALGAFGPANFQFRSDGGRARAFEINARFSGTTPLRALAGFDEVGMVLDQVVGGLTVEQPVVHDVAILRHFSETVVPAGELLS